MIYNGATYLLKAGRLDVEVGDSKRPDFLPRVKLKAWDNECNLSVGVIDNSNGAAEVVVDGDIIKWKKPGLEAHFYEKGTDERNEDGAYEFEVVLKEKPASNIVELSINVPKGLVFYYQPPLTPEEIADGCERPENVVGSYAVYHESQSGDQTKRGGKNYRTGKAFHIYRPEIIDSVGKKVYGDLKIDTLIQRMFITIPQDFLDSAAYPITVDPTFGYTTAGSSYYTGTGIFGGRYVSPAESGTIESISTYMRNSKLFDFNVSYEAAVYSDSSGNPDDKLAETSIASKMYYKASWHEGAALSCDFTASTAYWLMIQGSHEYLMYYDTGTSSDKRAYTSGGTFGSWPDPFSGTVADGTILSIYVTYTAAAGDVGIDMVPAFGFATGLPDRASLATTARLSQSVIGGFVPDGKVQSDTQVKSAAGTGLAIPPPNNTSIAASVNLEPAYKMATVLPLDANFETRVYVPAVPSLGQIVALPGTITSYTPVNLRPSNGLITALLASVETETFITIPTVFGMGMALPPRLDMHVDVVLTSTPGASMGIALPGVVLIELIPPGYPWTKATCQENAWTKATCQEATWTKATHQEDAWTKATHQEDAWTKKGD